jgi:hypothetical protein
MLHSCVNARHSLSRAAAGPLGKSADIIASQALSSPSGGPAAAVRATELPK